jgi:hypothetical protein
MSHATSSILGGVVLDWRHAAIGPPVPCVLCGELTCCRSPVKDLPCHKGCAEAWITTHATTHADRAQLIAACTPGKGVTGHGDPS